jgi:hypothetical protein
VTEVALPPVAFLRRLCGICPATPSPAGALRGGCSARPASGGLRAMVPARGGESRRPRRRRAARAWTHRGDGLVSSG